MNPEEAEIAMREMMEEHRRLHSDNMRSMEQERIAQDAQYQQLSYMAQQQRAQYSRQVSGLTFSDYEMEDMKERLLEAALQKGKVTKKTEDHFDEELFKL